jgi:hypothetical protein
MGWHSNGLRMRLVSLPRVEILVRDYPRVFSRLQTIAEGATRGVAAAPADLAARQRSVVRLAAQYGRRTWGLRAGADSQG